MRKFRTLGETKHSYTVRWWGWKVTNLQEKRSGSQEAEQSLGEPLTGGECPEAKRRS